MQIKVTELINEYSGELLQGFVASCMLFVTIVITFYQIKRIKEEKTPFLFIDEVIHTKINKSSDIPDLSLINYYLSKGSNQGLKGLDDRMVARQPAEDNTLFSDLEKAFLAEAIENSGDKVYFTYFNANPVIMLNFVSNKKQVVIEHCNTKITLHNYGALITKIKVNKAIIEYASQEKNRVLEGVNGLDLSMVIDKDKNLILMLDEATTNLEHSLCYVDEENFNKMPVGDFDLLRVRCPIDLRYKKMTFKFTVWNQYNEPYNMDLSVTRNGDILSPKTELKKRKG